MTLSARCQLVLYVAMFSTISLAQQSTLSTKRGGVCFRVDDDQAIENWRQYAAVFNAYNRYFSFALYLTPIQDQSEYINTIKLLQLQNHELLDHTPDHATQYFTLPPNEAISYAGISGVDHVVNNKVCLKYDSVNYSINYDGEGNGKLSGNRFISDKAGAFSLFKLHPDDYFGLYFPSTGKIFSFIQVGADNQSDTDTLILRDFWNEDINMPHQENIPFEIISVFDIRMNKDALNLLFYRTKTIAEKTGLLPPTSWIQPGGRTPQIRVGDICDNEVFRKIFRNSAIYRAPVIKCFNEVNTANINQYGMQWGDFGEDIDSFAKIKSTIADKIAKHYVLFGHSHFNGLLGGWQGYLNRMDSLLAWCNRNNIPVLTQTQWADVLYYNNEINVYENIFPPLDTDLDGNGVPDGYLAYPNFTDGNLDTSDHPGDQFKNSYSMIRKGSICYVASLAGLEKGENDFYISTKGSLNDSVEVSFSFPEKNGNSVKFKFPANTPNWVQYGSERSSTTIKTLVIPSDVSYCDVRISCSSYSGGIVKVGAFILRKRIDAAVKIISQPPALYVNNTDYKYKIDVASKYFGDTLSYKLEEHPAWLSMNRDGTLSGKTPQDIGSYYVKLSVIDQHANSDTQAFSIRICGKSLIKIDMKEINLQRLSIGEKRDTTLLVKNIGTDTLKITSLIRVGNNINYEYNPLIIPGGESKIKISISPKKNGPLNERLIILNNSPTPLDTISVIGYVDSITQNNDRNVYPAEYSLSQNYPNPFNGATVFKYTIRDESRVSITILNILGQVVKIVESDIDRTAGIYYFSWDGNNDQRHSLASNVYFCRMLVKPKDGSAKRTMVTKMVCVR